MNDRLALNRRFRRFEIAIAQEKLDDVRRRVEAFDWPRAGGNGWSDEWTNGASLAAVRELSDYWLNGNQSLCSLSGRSRGARSALHHREGIGRSADAIAPAARLARILRRIPRPYRTPDAP